jgi:hypothetical protein
MTMNSWIEDVRLCLQRALVDDFKHAKSCGDIGRGAFESHPKCYVQSGFCHVWISNLIGLAHVFEARDLFSWNTRKQFVETAKACYAQYQIEALLRLPLVFQVD